ncbi:MAG: sodium-dependent bicarbonate transport family permease [Cytophagales bacterium]|nr:sodium-dependent bicarbonate transport family permease [Cytophagales bacterium]
MSFHTILENFAHPATLFFFLGMIAIFVKSDLEVPPQIAKFLSIYLLFDIGIKGGEELFHSGFSAQVLLVIVVCVLGSFLIPFAMFYILKQKLSSYDAGAVAATYGSISAVTFATATAFLESQGESFGGYMVAGMALMESPAIIAGLILIRMNSKGDGQTQPNKGGLKHILSEAFFNGSVLLLVGSLVIGYVAGEAGEKELKPFVNEIFFGMLSLYMLDMGLLAARRIKELKKAGGFVVSFATLFPPIIGVLAILLSNALGYSPGDALLQTVLLASASYIAVPAAMRMAVPQVNMSILLPMSLGITFTFNISVGIPLYYFLIQLIWS